MNNILNLFRRSRNPIKDTCYVKGCDEPRKTNGLFPTQYCAGHWYILVYQRAMLDSDNENAQRLRS